MNEWTQISATVKTFQNTVNGVDEPVELIHVIKTGFVNKYIVAFEDAYEQFNQGKVEFHTKQSLLEKFNIDIDEPIQNFSSQIAERIMQKFPIEHTAETLKQVHDYIYDILYSTGLDVTSRKNYEAVNSYKQRIRNKYENVIDLVEEEFPHGLFSKDKSGELHGANLIVKKILAEYLEFKNNFSQLKQSTELIQSVPWQLCLKCDGEGQVSSIGTTTSPFRICPVCEGKKILQMSILQKHI